MARVPRSGPYPAPPPPAPAPVPAPPGGTPPQPDVAAATAPTPLRHSGLVLAFALAAFAVCWAVGFQVMATDGNDPVLVQDGILLTADIVALLATLALVPALAIARVPAVIPRLVRAVAGGLVLNLAATQLFLALDILAANGERSGYDFFVHAETFGVTLWLVSIPFFLLVPLPRGSAWWALVRSVAFGFLVGLGIAAFGAVTEDDFRDPMGVEAMFLAAGLVILASLPLDLWSAGWRAWRGASRSGDGAAGRSPA